MGKIRAYTKRQKWTIDDIKILTDKYAGASRKELVELFPSRNIRSIECKAHGLGLQKTQKQPRTRDEILKAKREGMARLRERDPEAAKLKHKLYHAITTGGKERNGQ